MDPFASVISLLRPQAVLSKVISGSGQWGVRYATYGHPSFCLMLAGRCWLTLESESPRPLDEGDFLLLPATPAFVLASDPEVPGAVLVTGESDESELETRHGDASVTADVRMFGGFFRFDPINAPLLLDLLPSAIHIVRDDPGADRLRQVVRLISEEAGADLPGRGPLLERLVEVMLIEALRRPLHDESNRPSGLLAGLADPHIASALRRMHGDVARPWTIAELAREAGMSRASFAARFAQAVGVPPMQYLLQWRMTLAKDMLRRQPSQLGLVATEVGYQSASAFSTAFSRHLGVSPSLFARQAGAAYRASAP